MLKRLPGLLVLFVLLAGCATALNISQRTLIEGEVDNWRDYAWVAQEGRVDPDIAAIDAEIRRLIDSRLAALGYTKTSAAEADFMARHSIFAHWEVDEMSERERDAIAEQAMMTGERVSDLDLGPREHGEGFLYVFLERPDGKVVWEGRIETPLDYRGQGRRKAPAAIEQLFAGFPAR